MFVKRTQGSRGIKSGAGRVPVSVRLYISRNSPVQSPGLNMLLHIQPHTHAHTLGRRLFQIQMHVSKKYIQTLKTQLKNLQENMISQKVNNKQIYICSQIAHVSMFKIMESTDF